MNKALVELVAALAAVTAFAALLAESWSYRGQSSYMPVSTTGLAVVLGLIWAAQATRLLLAGSDQRFKASSSDLGRFALVVVVTFFFVVGMSTIGFFTSTLIMVPLLACSLGHRRPVSALIATLCFIAILYAVFRLLLSIPLPPDALFGLVGL